MTNDINFLMTDEQAAQYLNCSVSWLRQLRVRGDGPSFKKLGRAVRYSHGDLVAWIESGTRINTLAL